MTREQPFLHTLRTASGETPRKGCPNASPTVEHTPPLLWNNIPIQSTPQISTECLNRQLTLVAIAHGCSDDHAGAAAISAHRQRPRPSQGHVGPGDAAPKPEAAMESVCSTDLKTFASLALFSRS